MAKADDIIEHPVTGERIRFLKTARDTGGARLDVEFWAKPGGFVAAEHVHRRQEERFEILSGTFRYRAAGVEHEAKAGDVAVVPPGVPHVWWNGGDDEVHFLVSLRPALRMEDFFESYFGLAQDGKTHPKTGMPNPLQTAVLVRAFADEVSLARPPLVVQRVVFGVLAAVGRMVGYRPSYAYPYHRQAGRSRATGDAAATTLEANPVG